VEEAARLFERAASHGQAAALFDLAVLKETSKDGAAEALSLYQDAAGQGISGACVRLGRAARDGELGLTADDAAARSWFRRAADLGDAEGALDLGAMLMSGRGGKKDEAAALAMYRLAADRGAVTAETNIGGIYWVGAAGVAMDRSEAVRHYRVAAETGNAVAARMLSVAYGTGDGVPRDEALQLRWARKAAVLGDAVAQNTLGYLILTGVGGTYDYVEAATWLSLAAERSAPGELHDKAVENLRTAMAQLKPDEQAEVARRVTHWREVNKGQDKAIGQL